jgi:hypothetical protein
MFAYPFRTFRTGGHEVTMFKFRDYSSILPLRPDEAERFLNRIRIDNNGCWIWTSTLNPKGYGIICLRGRYWATHRLLHEAMVGHVPAHMVTDHLCRVRACCNPLHLQVVTQAVNIRRADMPSGANHCNGRLTHCKYGHPFSGDNVYYYEVDGHVYRICRTCAARRTASFRRRQHAAARAGRLAQRNLDRLTLPSRAAMVSAAPLIAGSLVLAPEALRSHSSRAGVPTDRDSRFSSPLEEDARLLPANYSCHKDPADLYLLSLRQAFPGVQETL